MTKVAFACRDLEALKRRIASRAVGTELRVATRMRPKRASELIGGNLYWIVKHRLIAGQEILRFEDRDDGRIDIVCSADLAVVSPMPRRAHQGWRYLDDENAPGADDDGSASVRFRRDCTESSPRWPSFSRLADSAARR